VVNTLRAKAQIGRLSGFKVGAHRHADAPAQGCNSPSKSAGRESALQLMACFLLNSRINQWKAD
jgi:hypothetical protein